MYISIEENLESNLFQGAVRYNNNTNKKVINFREHHISTVNWQPLLSQI